MRGLFYYLFCSDKGSALNPIKENDQITKWPNNLFARTHRESPDDELVRLMIPKTRAIAEIEAGRIGTARFLCPGTPALNINQFGGNMNLK
jgi:hypothetical protein